MRESQHQNTSHCLLFIVNSLLGRVLGIGYWVLGIGHWKKFSYCTYRLGVGSGLYGGFYGVVGKFMSSLRFMY